jgi:hypothetical protein
MSTSEQKSAGDVDRAASEEWTASERKSAGDVDRAASEE